MLFAVAFAVAALIALLLQTTIFPSVPGLPIVPDLVVVLATYLGLRRHGVGGVAGTFFLGYALDTFSGTAVGLHAFSLVAVYLAVYVIARRLWVGNGLPLMIVVFFAACVRAAALVAGATLLEAPAHVWHHVVRYGVLEAGVAALVAPAVFAFVTWEEGLLEIV